MLPVPAPPIPVGTALGAVRELALAADPAQKSEVARPAGAHERAAWLVGMRQIIDSAEVAFTQVLADFDAAGDGQMLARCGVHPVVAARSAGHGGRWRRPNGCGSRAHAPARRPGLARFAAVRARRPDADSTARDRPPRVEATSNATEHDRAFEKVRSIHRALRALPPSERHRASETLTGLAPQLGVDDLRAAGRYLRHVIDPDGSARHAEEDYGRRWLSLAPMLDGMHSIDGVLDAETAGRLNAALAPLLVRTGPDDVRTTDQRRADGLSEVVDAAVRSGDVPWLAGRPWHCKSTSRSPPSPVTPPNRPDSRRPRRRRCGSHPTLSSAWPATRPCADFS